MIGPLARLLTAFVSGLLSTALASAPSTALIPAPEQISEHVWAWIGPYEGPSKANQGYRMNMAFVVGKQQVAVIDSGYSPAMAEAMIAHIKAITPQPIRYVINTNSQPHRIMGNPTFSAQGAQTIAAAEAVDRMVTDGRSFAATVERILELPAGTAKPPTAPDRQITETTPLDLGGVKLELIPVGHAHTAGSLIVHVPADNLVYAGDVLYSGRLLSLLPVSDLQGWIDAYEKLRGFADATLIPGHGRPARLQDFEQPTYEYLLALKTHMTEAVDNGVFMQDAINSFDDSRWRGLANYEELAGRNKHEAYSKQEAAAFGM